MTATEFEARIVEWARQRSDLEALVLGGSRALAQSGADEWSDWDFQLITTRPCDYQHTAWLEQIGPCWCAHAARTPRGVVKVSAVFHDGFEADFVPLAMWQMKLVYCCMRHPEWAGWMPHRLKRGIHETRGFMLGGGHRLLIGGPEWGKRFAALDKAWPDPGLSAKEFATHAAAFWQKSVWLFKTIARPEPRSAMHWLHWVMLDHVYPLLEEEARLAGRRVRPEARKAERWLDEARLRQTAIATAPEQRALARALLETINLFTDVSRQVAARRGFAPPDYTAVETWLRAELAKLLDVAR